MMPVMKSHRLLSLTAYWVSPHRNPPPFLFICVAILFVYQSLLEWLVFAESLDYCPSPLVSYLITKRSTDPALFFPSRPQSVYTIRIKVLFQWRTSSIFYKIWFLFKNIYVEIHNRIIVHFSYFFVSRMVMFSHRVVMFCVIATK